MKEQEFIQIIKSTLNSPYIGDDCAYLKDLEIVISQDSLVEDVHFKKGLITPYQLGYKTVMVNISDICASGAEPKYMTISLSLPKDTDNEFIEQFYKGAKCAAGEVEIVGGDITGSDKIYISAAVIGSAKGRKISSRSNAKAGYKIIVSGEHGNSAKGLEILMQKSPLVRTKGINNKFIKAHLMPEAQVEFSRQIAENIKEDYAMMDTSDGLADALFQIANASNVIIDVDTSNIPHAPDVDIQTVLYGGEDYQLVAAVPENLLQKISGYTIIGDVEQGSPSVKLDGKILKEPENSLFNHFKE